MPREIKQTTEASGFTCLVPDQLPEIFADGVSEIQVGMPVSRLLLHAVQTPANGDEIEHRIARLSVVIPTASLLELIANIAGNTSAEVVAGTNIAATGFVGQVQTQINRLREMTEAVEKKADKQK